MKQVFHSAHDRQEFSVRAQLSLFARFAHLRQLAHLRRLAMLALVTAGILMIGSPAWAIDADAQPLDLDAAGFDLRLDDVPERLGGAIQSQSDDVASAFVRPELDTLASLDRQAAPKALDPKSLGSQYREYGFSIRRAGIRWRFSLVESAGERS